MAPVEVRYFFGNLRTGTVVDEFSLRGVTMDTKLNDWGNLNATASLDQSGKDNIDIVNATQPGKNFIVVERNGVPIWDGIIWTRTWSTQSKTLQISARGLETYFEKVLITQDLSWEDYEQRNIMRELVNTMQSNENTNLGLTVPGSFPTIVTRDLTVLASEYKNYASVISSIADGVDGFDWTVSTSKNTDGTYLRSLRIGYPVLGSITDGLTFDFPGGVTNYYETESMTDAGTRIYVLGSGEGSDMLTASYENTFMTTNDWLRFDTIFSRKDVTDQNVLNSIASQQGMLRRAPAAFFKVNIMGDRAPVFGSYGLGDQASVYIIDARHPEGILIQPRIVAMSYRPPSDDGVEEAQLVFEGDELS